MWCVAYLYHVSSFMCLVPAGRPRTSTAGRHRATVTISRYCRGLCRDIAIKKSPRFEPYSTATCVCVCVLYCSSSISEEHASDSVPVDNAATHLCCLCSDWLEPQPRTLSLLCAACVVCHLQLVVNKYRVYSTASRIGLFVVQLMTTTRHGTPARAATWRGPGGDRE